MIIPPSGVRVWLATGTTDMRRGMNGLALQVQEALRRDPHVGDLYVFRGKRGNLLKILWHDGLGMSLYAKRLERGKSFGRRRPMVWSPLPPHSSAICLKGLTGGTHNAPGDRRWPARLLIRRSAHFSCLVTSEYDSSSLQWLIPTPGTTNSTRYALRLLPNSRRGTRRKHAPRVPRRW